MGRDEDVKAEGDSAVEAARTDFTGPDTVAVDTTVAVDAVDAVGNAELAEDADDAAFHENVRVLSDAIQGPGKEAEDRVEALFAQIAAEHGRPPLTVHPKQDKESEAKGNARDQPSSEKERETRCAA